MSATGERPKDVHVRDGPQSPATWRRPEGSAPRSDEIPNAYLPVRKLVAYSGLCERTLRGHLVDPVRPLPHFRIGGKILVRRSDFDAWAGQFRIVRQAADVDALVDDVVAGLR
jgi:hypothetical protein